MSVTKREDGRPIAVVVYRSLPRYRIPFYEALRGYLAARGFEFRLIHGQPSQQEVAKQDTGQLPWAERIDNRILRVGSKEVCWQPCLGLVRDADLVIVEQASRLLVNYVLLAWQALGGARIAFWGHGRNLQDHLASRLGEAVKRRMCRLPHWWFAYTDSTAALLRELGFPPDRITVVQNTIDTTTLLQHRDRTTCAELQALRKQLGLRGDAIVIFAGGLYRGKRIEFLIDAAVEARRRVPDLELLILGGGLDQQIVHRAARRFDWIHAVGPVFDAERVPYFMLSKLSLLPSLVGLGVVDSFVFETPLLTTDAPGHGPEIDYLVHDENGWRLPAEASPADYGEAVARLLQDEGLRARLQAGCRAAVGKYTLETMVERFGEGVIRAIGTAPSRGASRA